MTVKEVAKDSYNLATSLQECPFDSFWVVLLSDGTEIYQSDDNPSLHEASPWMRLKLLCKEKGVYICHMAYAHRSAAKQQINCIPDADGYFFSKRVRKMMAADPAYCGYTDNSVGIGYMHGAILKIHWLLDNGIVEVEEKDISRLEQKPFNLILRNA